MRYSKKEVVKSKMQIMTTKQQVKEFEEMSTFSLLITPSNACQSKTFTDTPINIKQGHGAKQTHQRNKESSEN